MLHNYDKKILVLDNDLNFQMKLKMQLLKLGINIDYVSTVEEAMKSLQEETPNIIFLEILLPQAKAFEFLKLRSLNAVLKKIPVIAVTSCKNKEVFIKAKTLGISDVIFKPINATTMHAKLEKYFSKENQLTVEYKKNNPLVEVGFNATMISLGRNVVQIEGPIRIPKERIIFEFDSDLFKENEISLRYCINMEESKFVTSIKYKSILYFVGVSSTDSDKIDTMVKKSASGSTIPVSSESQEKKD